MTLTTIVCSPFFLKHYTWFHMEETDNGTEKKSRKIRRILLFFIMIVYGFVFKIAYNSVGNGAFIFMNIFPAAAGLLLGMRAGFITGVATTGYVIFLGSTIHVEFRAFAPLITVSGIIMMIIGTGVGRLHDLSLIIKKELYKREKAEKALKKSQNQLELRVKERTLSLEQTADGLKREIRKRRQAQKEKDIKIKQLEEALIEVKTLQGLLPICSSCKKVRDDSGYWQQIESYIETRSGAVFSHSMCPECSEKFYSKEDWYIKMKKKEGH